MFWHRCSQGVLLLLLVLGLGQTAHAKDEASFRLALGSAPGVEEIEYDYPAFGLLTEPHNDDKGGNVEIQFGNRINADQPAGFVLVGGFFVSSHKGKSTVFVDDVARVEAYGVSVAPGLFINLTDAAHFEFKAEGGFGIADQEITGFSDGVGPYYRFGVSAGAYAHLAETLLLGAEVGYMRFRTFGEIDTLSGTVDVEFTGAGPTATVLVGFLF